MKGAKIRDDLLNADVRHVARAVMSTADSLQNYPPAVQLAALAYCFTAWARLTKQNVSDTFTAVNNIVNYSCGKRLEFQGVDQYLKHEILN